VRDRGWISLEAQGCRPSGPGRVLVRRFSGGTPFANTTESDTLKRRRDCRSGPSDGAVTGRFPTSIIRPRHTLHPSEFCHRTANGGQLSENAAGSDTLRRGHNRQSGPSRLTDGAVESRAQIGQVPALQRTPTPPKPLGAGGRFIQSGRLPDSSSRIPQFLGKNGYSSLLLANGAEEGRIDENPGENRLFGR